MVKIFFLAVVLIGFSVWGTYEQVIWAIELGIIFIIVMWFSIWMYKKVKEKED